MIMNSRMPKTAVIVFVLILFTTSGFCGKSGTNDSDTNQKTNSSQGGELKEAAPAPSAASDSVTKNSSNKDAVAGSSSAVANAELKASKIPSSIVSSPVSQPNNASNTSSGKEAPGATKDNGNSSSGKSGNSSATSANAAAETKSSGRTGDAASSKVVNSATQTQDSKGTSLETGKPVKDAPPAGGILPKTDDKKIDKKPSSDSAPIAPLDTPKGKPSDTESKPDVLPPPPDADEGREPGDGEPPPPAKSPAINKGAGLEVEENDDDLDEAAQGDKSEKESKASQAKVNRKESVEAGKLPKMHYDDEPENSHFLAYLLTIGVLCVAAYLVAHNRHKIMGLILEGRNGRRSHRSGSTSGRGVKYKRLEHEDAEGGVQLSSRDGGRVIY